jgi:hypothetical protein
MMDETTAPIERGDARGVIEETAEFEFTPLTPAEEVDEEDRLLIVGMHPCR